MDSNTVTLLKGQVVWNRFSSVQEENIRAIGDYESAVVELLIDAEELLEAFPHEEDRGIYVIAAQGKVVMANNKRAIAGYLDYMGHGNDLDIMVHKLGSALDAMLVHKLRDSSVLI